MCDVDTTFNKAIVNTCNYFCVLGEPLVPSTQTSLWVDHFKKDMSTHYFMMKKLGVYRKERLARKSNSCNRVLWYNEVLSFFDIKKTTISKKNCMNCAMVLEAVCHSKILRDNMQKRLTCSAVNASVKTFLKHVLLHSDGVVHSLANVLHQSKHTIATLDKNQKLNPSKFQRWRLSTKFVKATALYFHQYNPCKKKANANNVLSKITHVSQQMPSPDPMLPFE